MAHKTTVRAGLTKLPYGAYFGASHIHQEVPGFSLSLVTPTLRAEDVPLHTHDSVTFVLVLSGSYVSSADRAAPVSTTPVLIYNPAGVVHRDSFVLADGQFLAVSISAQSLRVALDWAALPSAARAYSSGAGFKTAFALAQQCATPGPTSSSIMEAMCWELLSAVSGACLWPEQQTHLPPWVDRARELLHDRCSDNLQIAEIAQQLGVHPVYFARTFRRAFRCTPGEYRMRCRLRNALSLMKQAHIPLSEVALRSGFFDQSHFCAAFRKHFATAPQTHQRHCHQLAAQNRVQFVQEET